MHVGNSPWLRVEHPIQLESDRSSLWQSPSRRSGKTVQSQPSRESAAVVQAESRTSLTVVTAEGDRVTISLAAQAKLASTSQSGSGGSSRSLSASVSSQARVTVDGSLNKDELQDLGELLVALGKATNQAQRTGSLNASTLSETVAGLDSLAAFSYRHRQIVEAGALVRAFG